MHHSWFSQNSIQKDLTESIQVANHVMWGLIEISMGKTVGKFGKTPITTATAATAVVAKFVKMHNSGRHHYDFLKKFQKFYYWKI